MSLTGVRNRLRALLEDKRFSTMIVALIIINAAILGMVTYPQMTDTYGPMLETLDNAILYVFIAELCLRLFAYGGRFFRDPWSLFDTVVVAVAAMPANGAFAVLRAARVLRVMRLLSMFPRLRRVIEGLILALPGLASIGAILCIIFYVFAVMATKLFGAGYPDWFGTLHGSMFSLFQVMTLEGWADMVRTIAKTHPLAPTFFVIYILIATFTILNLFIAVVVDAMQHEHREEMDQESTTLKMIQTDLASLHRKIDERQPNP